jgi:hypothetical protein
MVRKQALTVGGRLKEQSLRELDNPPMTQTPFT